MKELLLNSFEVAAVVTHSTNRIEISMDNIMLSAQGAERQRKDVPVLHVAFGMQLTATCLMCSAQIMRVALRFEKMLDDMKKADPGNAEMCDEELLLKLKESLVCIGLVTKRTGAQTKTLILDH